MRFQSISMSKTLVFAVFTAALSHPQNAGLTIITVSAGRSPLVEVRDATGKPVAGSIVSFTLPDMGARGIFGNGNKFFSVTRGGDGRAAAGVIRPNGVAGTYNVGVNASYQGH